MTPEDLGYEMFRRRCELDGFEEDVAISAWLCDDGIQEFWTAEASFVMDRLGVLA